MKSNKHHQLNKISCGTFTGVCVIQTFGVEVLGMDLSSNMVEIAMERAVTEKLPLVSHVFLDTV